MMSWIQFVYLLFAIAVAVSAVDGMQRLGKPPASMWTILVCAALWPVTILGGLARAAYLKYSEKGEKVEQEETGSGVPPSTRRH